MALLPRMRKLEREEKSRIYVYYMPAKGQGEAKFLPMIYECNCDLDILFPDK